MEIDFGALDHDPTSLDVDFNALLNPPKNRIVEAPHLSSGNSSGNSDSGNESPEHHMAALSPPMAIIPGQASSYNPPGPAGLSPHEYMTALGGASDTDMFADSSSATPFKTNPLYDSTEDLCTLDSLVSQMQELKDTSSKTRSKSKGRKRKTTPVAVAPSFRVKTEPGIKLEPPLHLEEMSEDGLNPISAAPGKTPEGIEALSLSVPKLGWEMHDTTSLMGICDAKKRPVSLDIGVEADKGFNYSGADDAFVCQKKNHFQISASISTPLMPEYVQTPSSLERISCLKVEITGLKIEIPRSPVEIQQSQTDRSKLAFGPMDFDLKGPGKETKVVMARLHFGETTANNMRKRGLPNPDQRYFVLVVTIWAQTEKNIIHKIASVRSQRVIVRASNPGQFDPPPSAKKWRKGTTEGSVVTDGPVGIGTDTPTEALSVVGNVRTTGSVLQTSDYRVKEDFEEVDTKQQLQNIKQLPMYHYNLKESWANIAGRQDSRAETGIVAQELEVILPDAVTNAGRVVLEDGEEIDDLKVVNKERVFMENIGAVKELCKMTENLDVRIKELETLNNSMRSGVLERTSRRRKKGMVKRLRGEEDDEKFPYWKLFSVLAVLVILTAGLSAGVTVLIHKSHDGKESSPAAASTTTSPTATTEATTTAQKMLRFNFGDSDHSILTQEDWNHIIGAAPFGNNFVCSQCSSAEFCVNDACACKYGADGFGQCLQAPLSTDPHCDCEFGECLNSTAGQCSCNIGWSGESCSDVTASNDYLSGLTLEASITDSSVQISRVTPDPFFFQDQRQFFNVATDPNLDLGYITLVLHSEKFSPDTQWMLQKHIYGNCEDNSVGTTFQHNANLTHPEQFFLPMQPSGFLYMVVSLKAPGVSQARDYHVVILRDCEL